jgi:hypothetical protein
MSTPKDELRQHTDKFHILLGGYEQSPERRAIWDKVGELEQMIAHHGRHLKVQADDSNKDTTVQDAPAPDSSPIPADGQIASDPDAPATSTGSATHPGESSQNYGVAGLVPPGSGSQHA